MRAQSRPICLSFVGVLVLSLTACDDKSKRNATTSPSATSTATTENAAASARPPAIPTDGDPAVVAELRKFAPCERTEGFRKADCAAEATWDAYRTTYTADDDPKATKAGKLTRACLSLVGDANDSVREAATLCLGAMSDGVEDKRAALLILLSRFDSETSEGVRTAMTSTIESLDPTKNGAATETLALAKKLLPHESASGAVRDLLSALTPSDGEPTADTVSFALELVKGSDFTLRQAAADTLGHAKARAPEACAALLGLVETKKYPWGEGLNGMATQHGACAATYDKVVATVLEKLGEGDGYDQGLGGADAIYLQRMLEQPGFTANQKSKLLAAVEKRRGTETRDTMKKSLGDLADKLKK